MKPYHLYFLYSNSINQFYIGSADKTNIRLRYHNSANKGWTRRGRPWVLVFSKEFSSKSEAQKWERWIKNQKRRKLVEKIIEGTFDWNITLMSKAQDVDKLNEKRKIPA